MFSYRSQEWQSLRLKALARARYTCQLCGANVRAKHAGRVDHILTVREHPAMALVLENLRVLCVNCDAKRHRDKGYKKDRVEVGLDGYPVNEL